MQENAESDWPEQYKIESTVEAREAPPHGVGITTPAFPEGWAGLADWLVRMEVKDEFLLLADATLLVNLPSGVGSVLASLSSPTAHALLDEWAQESLAADILFHLSRALHRDPAPLLSYRPLPVEKRAGDQLRGHLQEMYLLALLVARLPPVPRDQQVWFEKLRLWILVHAIERAAGGVMIDKSLRILASKLRLAHDGDDQWLELFRQMETGYRGVEGTGLGLIGRCQRLLARSLTGATPLSAAQGDLLNATMQVAKHAHQDVSSGNHLPKLLSTGRSWGIPPEHVGRPSEVRGPDDQWVGHVLPFGDEDAGDLLEVEVDPDQPEARQQLSANTVLLASVEQQQFLPWSWQNVTPQEHDQLHRWVMTALNSPRPEDQAIAASVWVAVATGRSLRRALAIELAEDMGEEWRYSPRRAALHRRPPRRQPGWRPGSAAIEWIRPPAPELWVALPPDVARVLAAGHTSRPDATTLGALWDSPWWEDPERVFRRQMEHVAPRVTPSMLSQILPMRAFREHADGTYARLIASHR